MQRLAFVASLLVMVLACGGGGKADRAALETFATAHASFHTPGWKTGGTKKNRAMLRSAADSVTHDPGLDRRVHELATTTVELADARSEAWESQVEVRHETSRAIGAMVDTKAADNTGDLTEQQLAERAAKKEKKKEEEKRQLDTTLARLSERQARVADAEARGRLLLADLEADLGWTAPDSMNENFNSLAGKP